MTPQPNSELDIAAIAREMIDALDHAGFVAPPTQRYPSLDFSTGYLIANECLRLRRSRGERPVGRKIGYTNRNMWPQYNVHEPIWSHVFAHTMQYAAGDIATQSLVGMVAPRIEPEIAVKLRAPLPLGCKNPALILTSVEWVARAFEIVDCHYADWKFTGPDSVIDFSHHAALVTGTPLTVTPDNVADIAESLRECRVTLVRGGVLVDSGSGSNALGHPALALAYVADVISSQPEVEPLAAGEVITTGSLTSALPVTRGETWRTETDGLALPPLIVRFS